MANKRITEVDTLDSLNSDESFFVNQNNSIKQINRNNIVFGIANGGTGATNVDDARINLGITATTSELSCLDGVTSNIQAQLNAKQSKISGGASTITNSNLDASRALISNGSGKVAVSAVTSTELEYLDGVTSNVQAQLNSKAPSYTYGIEDLDAGTSELTTGKLYFVYE